MGSPSKRRPRAETKPVSAMRSPPPSGSTYSAGTPRTQPQVDSPTVIALRCSMRVATSSSEALAVRRSVRIAIGPAKAAPPGLSTTAERRWLAPSRRTLVSTGRGAAMNCAASHVNNA
jgi:hypothetical protein